MGGSSESSIFGSPREVSAMNFGGGGGGVVVVEPLPEILLQSAPVDKFRDKE